MKKLLSLLLVACIMATSVPNVFAVQTRQSQEADTNVNVQEKAVDPYTPLNSNFKKVATISPDDEIFKKLNIADWCKEDFIHLYEIGFTEITPIRDGWRNRDGSETYIVHYNYNDIVNFAYKFLITYNNQPDNSAGNWSSKLKYLQKEGIITKEENIILNDDKRPKRTSTADFFINSNRYIYRKQLQIILTRLFKVVDIGEPINSLSRIVDVDNSAPDTINFDGVLELFNLGIFAGNEYGMFNPYDEISLNEYITVLARICFPNRRIHINKDEYERKLEKNGATVETYNTVTPEWSARIRELVNFDYLYLVPHPADRYMTAKEMLYIIYQVSVAKAPAFAEPEKKLLDPNSEECLKEYEKFISYKTNGNGYFSRNYEMFEKDASKKNLALVLATEAIHSFKVPPICKTAIKTELTKGLSDEYIYYLNYAINFGLIENNAEDFNSSQITQAEFEKMLIKYAMQFSTFVPTNNRRQGSERLNLVTDPALLPKNADVFPYILDVAPKEVYECFETLPYTKHVEGTDDQETAVDPIYTYKMNRFTYNSLYYIENYFDVILNIDYRTINLEDFLYDLIPYVYYDLKSSNTDEITHEKTYLYLDTVKKYIEYVKENKIIMKGKATLVLPFAFRRQPFLVRTKLELDVISSEVESPKLFFSRYLFYVMGTQNSSVRYCDVYVAMGYDQITRICNTLM